MCLLQTQYLVLSMLINFMLIICQVITVHYYDFKFKIKFKFKKKYYYCDGSFLVLKCKLSGLTDV